MCSRESIVLLFAGKWSLGVLDGGLMKPMFLFFLTLFIDFPCYEAILSGRDCISRTQGHLPHGLNLRCFLSLAVNPDMCQIKYGLPAMAVT